MCGVCVCEHWGLHLNLETGCVCGIHIGECMVLCMCACCVHVHVHAVCVVCVWCVCVCGYILNLDCAVKTDSPVGVCGAHWRVHGFVHVCVCVCVCVCVLS